MLTGAQKEQALALRRSGWGYDEIARKIGSSRGAIAGLVDRAKRAGEDLPKRRSRGPREKVAPIAAPSPSAPIHTHDHHDHDEASVGAGLLTIGKTLHELRAGDCRFVLDARHEGQTLYCGGQAMAGQSWCRACAGVVYRPRESR